MKQPLYFLISLALSFILLPSGVSLAQDVFDECSFNSENNATIVIPVDASVDIGTGYSLKEGDEIASITGNGICAGVGVWEGENLSFSISGQDENLEIKGFEPGEALNFSVYHQAAEDIIEAEVSYESCSEGNGLCNDEGTYQNDALYTLSANVIPVELTSFTVKQDGASALLEWSTASETNNAGFEVQHQSAGSSEWTTEKFVEGHGTTSQPQAYAIRFEDLNPGTHRFRLHQIDLDGTSEYHPTRDLLIELDEAYSITSVSPNPVSDFGRFSITVAQSQHVQIDVFNQLGQQVDRLFDGVLSGSTAREFEIRASDFSSGVYLVRISSDRFVEVLNLVVVQ